MRALPVDLKTKSPLYGTIAILLVLMIIVAVESLIGLATIILSPVLTTALVIGPFLLLAFFCRAEFSYFAFVFLLPFWDISLYQAGWIDVRPADLAVITMVMTYIINLVVRKEPYLDGTALGLPIALFAFWAVASILWGSPFTAGVPLVHFVYGLAIYFMTVNILRDSKSLKGAMTAWVLAGVISALIAIYQFTIAPIETFTKFGQIRTSAFFMGGNRLANFLTVCILVSFGRTLVAKSRFQRVMFVTAISVMLAGLLSTLSRAAVVGLVAGSVFFAYYSKSLRKPLLLSLLIFLTIAFAITQGKLVELFFERFTLIFSGLSEVSARRVTSWRDAYEIFLMSPLTGAGFGSFAKIIEEGGTQLSLLRVHNVYLAVLSELGLIGFSLFLGLLTAIFFFVKKTLALVKKDYYSYQLSLAAASGLIAYLVCTLTQAIYVQERGMWAFIGLSMATLIICRNQVAPKT